MALGKVYRSFSLKLNRGIVNDEEKLGLRFVRCNSGLGRKRIGISNEMEEDFPFPLIDSPPLLKRHCSEKIKKMMIDDDDGNEKSALESLPQDVLIRIICGVGHEDLKQLFNVSKSIRESTIMAKKSHFAYSTPTKTKAFRTFIDFEEPSELEAIEEAPNAPRQGRSRRLINRKKLADISVALFS